MAATARPRDARSSDSLLERLFNLSARGSTVGTEVRAGLTTFMVMSYIIVVNASIITLGARMANTNDVADLDVSFAAVVTSTCLVAGLMSAAMGLHTNLPFAMAPEMGLNGVVAQPGLTIPSPPPRPVGTLRR